MPERIFQGTYHPPVAPRGRERSRIKRRARDLSRIAYEIYLEAMEKEFRAGMLPSAGIEFWEPGAATKIKKALDGIAHQLHVASGIAQVLFP